MGASGTLMQVHVRLFAAYREQVGAKEVILELPEGSSLREVAAALEARHPGLSLAGGLCARNEEYASPTDQARAGDRLAFFPPVSGGASEPYADPQADCLEVCREPIEATRYLVWASAAAYGAVSSFVGTVRSPNAGL
ncbi:MAG TPA: MoaD/ThiS family protein, partial [Trueperaceae bacterium]